VPKKRKQPETFDEWVGAIIDSKLTVHSWTQSQLADSIGLSLTLVGRSIRGSRALSVLEFERIASVLGEDPGDLLSDVLQGFGGLDKLLSEIPKPVSEDSSSIDDLETRRLQKEAEQMSVAEIERNAIAATQDPERRTDEPDPT